MTYWCPACQAARSPIDPLARTAGFELAYEGFHLLIDPYVTRVGLGDLLRRRTVAPHRELVAAQVPKADAVLVGHTHFDHVLDVPEIVRSHGCPAYGSGSVATLLMAPRRRSGPRMRTVFGS